MIYKLTTPLTFKFLKSMKYSFSLVKFNLPDLGEKIKQGTIKKLYIKEGDKVQEFQKLADVASDKQFTEITASDAGVIKKIYYKEEDVCQVGNLLLEIEVADGKSDSQPQVEKKQASTKVDTSSSKPAQQVSKSQSPKVEKSDTVLATPYVRGLIKQKKLDITKIKGTGPQGRILQSDIHAFISQKSQPTSSPQQKSQPHTSSHPSSPSAHSSKTIKMSPFEKGMQKSMTQSNKIPHLYLHQQFDITQTQKMRKSLKSNSTKITLMSILIKTFSLALKKYPIINSTYQPSVNQFQYTIQGSHNVSIAIDSPNGLVVPNIKNVQELSLVQVQAELEKLRNLGSQGKLGGKELNNGTVCLSNIGTLGGTTTCPLILPPQVCIVGIGKMQILPRYVKDQVVARTILTVSYGCDHRVIDGATVAKFSNQWKKVLENPYLALAEMN